MRGGRPLQATPASGLACVLACHNVHTHHLTLGQPQSRLCGTLLLFCFCRHTFLLWQPPLSLTAQARRSGHIRGTVANIGLTWDPERKEEMHPSQMESLGIDDCNHSPIKYVTTQTQQLPQRRKASQNTADTPYIGLGVIIKIRAMTAVLGPS